MTQEHRFFQILETLRLTARKSITLSQEKISTWRDLIPFTFDFLSEDRVGDDKGVYIVGGQLTVGAPGAGQESTLGEGDSYPVPIAYHCTIANTTDLVITGAVDVSIILQSDNDSTTGLFGGEDIGDYILVGSDYSFGGVKSKIETAGTVEPLNVLGEYLRTNAPAWTTALFMVTDADFPYEQKGNSLASESGISEQWRFGFNPLVLPVPWDQVTLTINGEQITKYWARFRVTDTITLDPLIQQIKLHSNRFEINADGNTEYFGRARYPKTILVVESPNADKTPASQNISIATGITETRLRNKFVKNKQDGFILRGTFPVGMDSSIPVQFIVDWYPNAAVAGDIELELEVVAVKEGFVYDGSATPVVATPVVTSVVSGDQLGRFQSVFLVPVITALPNDLIYGSLFRDATGGSDTYDGDIVITDYKVVGYFWKS